MLVARSALPSQAGEDVFPRHRRKVEDMKLAFKSSYRLCVMAAALLWATAAVAQDNRGSPEQRAACAPDAFRLCADYIPDPNKVEGCLRHRKSELSDPCRTIFEQAGDPSSSRNR